MDKLDNDAVKQGLGRRPQEISAGAGLSSELSTRDLERIEFLSKPKNLRAFLRTTFSLLSPLGFNNFGLLLARPEVDDVQKLFAYPDINREYYIERGLHRGDLHVKHCLASNEPMNQLRIKDYVYSAPVENELLAMNKEISLKLEEQGFSDYHAFGFDTACGESRAIFSFSSVGASAGSLRHRARAHMDEIRAIAQAVEYVGSNKHGMSFMRGRGQGVIANAPLRLLDILANDNVNLKEAAMLMGITEGTANIHVRTIKEAFKVPTVTRAVVEALQRGMIFRRQSNT